MIWLGNRNVNLEMVREGYAETYREYLKEPYSSKFIDAEQEARSGRKGIWRLSNYERQVNLGNDESIRGTEKNPKVLFITDYLLQPSFDFPNGN